MAIDLKRCVVGQTYKAGKRWCPIQTPPTNTVETRVCACDTEEKNQDGANHPKHSTLGREIVTSTFSSIQFQFQFQFGFSNFRFLHI